MEAFTPGSTNYIKEAARRALTNSSLGYTVISNATEGAKFGGVFTPTETDFNTGTYQGIKTFAMNPGDTFGFILAPQDSLQTIFNGIAHLWYDRGI
ncbi:MAG TPA: hypothetical protein V6D13_01265 [Halomicronema sp.]